MGIFTDKFVNTFNERANSSNIYDILQEVESNPENVRIYTYKNGQNYIPTLDLEQYMTAACISSVDEAVDDILSVNAFITKENTMIISNGCSETFLEHLIEQNSIGGLVLEKSVENDAINVAMANDELNRILMKARSNAENKKEIQERINALKKCVKNMQNELNKINNGEDKSGQIKYTLKALFIPYYRLYNWNLYGDEKERFNPFKISSYSYKEMLRRYIDRTNEAIEFLEKELKKM